MVCAFREYQREALVFDGADNIGNDETASFIVINQSCVDILNAYPVPFGRYCEFGYPGSDLVLYC